MASNDERLYALGTFIRDQRTRLGLTQTQLAERLGWAQERISTLENGKYGMPSLPGLARLAEALEVPVTTFLAVTGLVGRTSSREGGSTTGTEQNTVLLYALQQLLAIDPSTLKEALDQASDQLAAAMSVDKVDAFVYDQPSNSLIALGTSNTPMGRLQHESGLERVPLANRERTAQVYETGVVFSTGDALHDPGISVGVKETLGVRSMLAVPLRVNGNIHGVLVAESATPDRFTAEDERFFGAVARWVGMIAHRAELTESMRQSVAEEARQSAADEVITALAHDLGNVLAPLQGRLDLLRRGLHQDGRQRELEHAVQALHAVADIQQTVARLLDLSRLDQGLFALSRQPLDLAELVERVAEELRPSADGFQVRVPDSLEVEGDPARLREVLVNLVTNAIQQSPDGAPIVLAADTEQRENGLWAVVSVTDVGPGFASDMLPRLFQRHSSDGGAAGLGLELYLSRRLVEAHGGTLTVETAAGRGSTFWLALPAGRE